MRPIAYLLTVMLLAPLAGCGTLGSSPDETAQDRKRADQQQALLPPEPGLTPRERYRKSLALLEVGQANRAKSELLAYLAEEPGGRYGNRSRDLLQQIDGDPEEMLGKEYFLYEMQAGDSLSTVAKQYLGDPLKFYVLARYNDLENPSQMKVGQTIKVPGQKPADVPDTVIADPAEKPEPDATDDQLATVPEGDQIQVPDDDVGVVVPPVEDGEPKDIEPEQVDIRDEELAIEGVQTVMTNAQDMASAGDFEGAANVLEDGMLRYPDDELIPKFAAANYITLADQFSSNEQYDRAEEYLKRAADLDPENSEIARSRMANYVAQADRARDEGRSDEEIGYLTKALEFDRENEEIRSRLSDNFVATADAARADGRYEEERDALALALKLDPENPAIRDRMIRIERFDEAEGLYKRGQEYQKANQKIEAYDAYQKAIEIFPDYEPALDASAGLKPQVVDLYYKQGKQAFSREDLVEAIDWFDKALEVDPDHQPSKVARNQAIEIQNALKKIQNGN